MAGSPKRTRLSAVGKTAQRASKRARAVKPREPMLFGCPADVVESSARMTSRTWRLANGQRRATGDAESTRETFELVGLILVLWCIGFVAALAAVEAVS